MRNLAVKMFEGNQIEFKVENGAVFANATGMCKAFGKEVKHWLANESTKELISEVSSEVGIPTSQLIIVKKGNSKEFTQGTWIHEELLLDLASWIKIKFRRWCQKQIATLLREGNVSIRKAVDIKNKRLEIMEMNAKVRISKRYESLAGKVETESMKNVLLSYSANALAGKEIIELPKTEGQEKTLTATEMGEMLGGVSKHKIGMISNAHNLKTEEFGKWFHDKSPYSNKEIPSFRYYEKAVEEFRKYIGGLN